MLDNIKIYKYVKYAYFMYAYFMTGGRKRLILIFVSVLFFVINSISLVSAVECGSVPSNGCTVSQSTTFQLGTYNLPSGISIVSNNVVLDCNGATLQGGGIVL